MGVPNDITVPDVPDGHVFTLASQLRAVQVISVAEVARIVKQAVNDNTGMYEDADEAMRAIQAYVSAAILDAITPTDDETDSWYDDVLR